MQCTPYSGVSVGVMRYKGADLFHTALVSLPIS